MTKTRQPALVLTLLAFGGLVLACDAPDLHEGMAAQKRYGSFDAYRREALGFDDAETRAFRELALEGPSSL